MRNSFLSDEKKAELDLIQGSSELIQFGHLFTFTEGINKQNKALKIQLVINDIETKIMFPSFV